jgi:hypothetical protein
MMARLTGANLENLGTISHHPVSEFCQMPCHHHQTMPLDDSHARTTRLVNSGAEWE